MMNRFAFNINLIRKSLDFLETDGYLLYRTTINLNFNELVERLNRMTTSGCCPDLGDKIPFPPIKTENTDQYIPIAMAAIIAANTAVQHFPGLCQTQKKKHSGCLLHLTPNYDPQKQTPLHNQKQQ